MSEKTVVFSQEIALDRRYSCAASIDASAERVFARADDHERLSSHMNKRSWMMGGGRMTIQTDDGRGKQLGSRISLEGRFFGIRLSVQEVVTEYSPPLRKTWRTIGSPRLLIIEHYQMGFVLTPENGRTHLSVFIDYRLPDKLPWHWFGVALGASYARWCTETMASDLARYFQ